MVLWKKESSEVDALFINLLTTAGVVLDDEYFDLYYEMQAEHCSTEKDDDESTDLRESGNDEFRLENWNEAMDLYNKSLRYATAGSENISLAYANRSVCFFKMQKCDQCLADIELAKKANYPERLMPKLNDRQAKCMKLMVAESWKPDKVVEPALTLDAHEKLPGLANVLEVRSNDELGNHIVAKCDIDAGQIVMKTEMLVAATIRRDEIFCKTCFKELRNFIPCPKCCDAMFCDDKCMAANQIHAIYCAPSQDYQLRRVIESILIAMTEFPTTDALMEFVESALAAPGFDRSKCESDFQTKYSLFLKLNYKTKEMDRTLERLVFWCFRQFFNTFAVEQRFQTERERRFLMHLVLQHHYILEHNSKKFCAHNVVTDETYPTVSGICPFVAMLTSSCVRNASIKHWRNQVFVYTIRPVKEGEQLFIEKNPWAAIETQCDCGKCTPMSEKDRNRLIYEPNFQYLLRSEEEDYEDPDKRAVLKGKSRDLLNEYGRLSWSREIQSVAFRFDHCIEVEYRSRSEREF